MALGIEKIYVASETEGPIPNRNIEMHQSDMIDAVLPITVTHTRLSLQLHLLTPPHPL
jgi:hypothetical protein